MQEFKEKKDAQRELFGELFGFKVGDRVKRRKKYYNPWLKPRDRGYWRYGRVKQIYHGEDWKPYRVLFDGDTYSLRCSAKELVRVRKYVRKKKEHL